MSPLAILHCISQTKLRPSLTNLKTFPKILSITCAPSLKLHSTSNLFLVPFDDPTQVVTDQI